MVKKALLVGCNYPGTEAELHGCANDVKTMHQILMNRFGFSPNDITIMLDNDPSTTSPTGKNVKDALVRLCSGTNAGDTVFFHFSGHGVQIPAEDPYGGEADGKDECIVPTDMNLIVDQDLRNIVANVPTTARFTMISDCCHSGGMLDGQEVIIDGAKTPRGGSKAPDAGGMIGSMLAMAGGGGRGLRAEDVVKKSRDLPLDLFMKILAQKTGQNVDQNNIRMTLGKVFGGDASVMVNQFLSVVQKIPVNKNSEAGRMLGMLVKVLGMCAKPPKTQGDGAMSGPPPAGWVPPPAGVKPPADQLPASRDIATLVTGCQSTETSADACPSGDKSQAFGALTNAIHTILENAPPGVTNRQVVTAVRAYLSQQGYAQNPCLECSNQVADLPFIC